MQAWNRINIRLRYIFFPRAKSFFSILNNQLGKKRIVGSKKRPKASLLASDRTHNSFLRLWDNIGCHMRSCHQCRLWSHNLDHFQFFEFRSFIAKFNIFIRFKIMFKKENDSHPWSIEMLLWQQHILMLWQVAAFTNDSSFKLVFPSIFFRLCRWIYHSCNLSPVPVDLAVYSTITTQCNAPVSSIDIGKSTNFSENKSFRSRNRFIWIPFTLETRISISKH